MSLGTARCLAVALCCSGDRLSTVRLINKICCGQCVLPVGLASGTLPRKLRCGQFTAQYLKQLGVWRAKREPAKHFAVTSDAMIKSSIKLRGLQKRVKPHCEVCKSKLYFHLSMVVCSSE